MHITETGVSSLVPSRFRSLSSPPPVIIKNRLLFFLKFLRICQLSLTLASFRDTFLSLQNSITSKIIADNSGSWSPYILKSAIFWKYCLWHTGPMRVKFQGWGTAWPETQPYLQKYFRKPWERLLSYKSDCFVQAEVPWLLRSED